MDDLLQIYDTLPNKIHLWSMMRYFTIIYKIYYDISIEIHKPRNSNELFGYFSDKYWAKLLYGLSDNIPNKLMLRKVTDGSRINLKQYWYPILLQNNNVIRTDIMYDISYYILDHSLDIKDKGREKLIHHNIFNENKITANILNYIITIKCINYDTCLYLLKYICTNHMINDILIETFYKYMISPPTDPCSETENREDMLTLLENYL